MRCWSIVLIVVAVPFSAFAQSSAITEPLVSDRPDFTESTETIPAKHFQLEGGFTATQESDAGRTDRSYALPEVLLRIGLSEDVEARLFWEGALIDNPASGGGSHGSADLSIGSKLAFGEMYGVNFSSIIEMELPTGSNNRTSDRVQPGVKLLWSTGLTDAIAIAGNINYALRVVESDRFSEWASSVSFGTPLTERIGGYVEYFGIYPDSTNVANAESYLNGGVTYSIHADLQLDARVGTGLNENAADLFSGVGFVWRR